MENYTIFIMSFLILIFIGLIHRKTTSIQSTKESFRGGEPPHFLRRAGLSPPYCPFRDQY